MLKFQIGPSNADSFPGNLTEFFENDKVFGWAHWQGDPQAVTPQRLQEIITKIKDQPDNPNLILPTHLSLVIITGSNDQAKFQFFAGAKVLLKRGGKTVIISKSATGKLLETDLLTFSCSQYPVDLPKINPSKEESPFVQNKNFQLHPPGNISLGSKFIYTNRLQNQLALFAKNISEKPKSIYLILVIILIIASSLLYQLRSKTSEKKDQLITQMGQSLDRQINEAKTLNEINPSLARLQMLTARQNLLKSANENFGDWQANKSPEKDRIEKLINLANQELATISRIYIIKQFETQYDTSLLRSDAKISSAALHQGKIILLDGNGGALFRVNSQNKSGEIVSSDNKFKGGKKIDFSGDQISVFGDKVVGYPKNLNVDKSDSWGSIATMKSFSANVYLLDPPKNSVWKYSPTDTGYLGPKNYLGEGLTINLSGAVDMTINGEVIILTKSGGLVRFASGIPQTTAISGIDRPLNNPTSVFSNEDTQNIYILDSGNNRVVITTNKGEYVSQYQLPANSNLSPIILADETVKKVFLVSGSKILSFDLK